MTKPPRPYPLGAHVTWREGQREHVGLIDVVHRALGVPAEYGVCPLREDGTPAPTLQHRHHAELTPKGH